MDKETRKKEIADLIYAIVLELIPRSRHGGALAANVGAELGKRAGLDAIQTVGYRRLTDFIRSCCPNLSIATMDSGAVLIAPMPQSGVQPKPTPESTVHRPSSEPLSPIDISMQSIDWLATRYAPFAVVPFDAQYPDTTAGLDALRQGDFQKVVSLFAAFVPRLIADARSSGITPTSRRILAACCRADAELAAEAGQWEIAADIFLVAAEVSKGSESEIVPPWRYGQIVASGQLGAEALELSAEEIGQVAVSGVIKSLAVAMGRASALRDVFTDGMLGGRSKLFFEVREAVVSNLLHESYAPRELRKRRPKELEYEAFDVWGNLIGEFQSKSIQLRDLVLTAIGDPLRVHASSFIAHFGRYRGLLYAKEEAAFTELQPLLTRDLARYLSHPETPMDSWALTFQSSYAQTLQALSDRLAQSSWISGSLFAPISQRISRLVQQSRKDASLRLRPDLQLRKSRRKYPLARADRDISIPLEIQNNGPGLAEDATLEIGPLPDGIAPTTSQLDFGSISPGADVTRNLTINIAEPIRSLRAPVQLRYRDVLGETFSIPVDFVIEDQSGDPDWDALLANAPYTLQPVEELQNLRGRQAQLNKLRINVATLNGTIVWGQKRVGKTSVARVLFNELNAKKDVIVLYTRKGDVAGYDEGSFGRDLAERLVDECKSKVALASQIEIPSVGDFGGRLTRFTRVVENIRKAGIHQSIVLILDEFDELNPGFYRGQRGENFFGTLRALSERRVAFVLIGSERMPAIFKRYAQLLNKFDTLQIDIVDHPDDLRDMIEQPVVKFIEFDPEAVALVARLSGGNPYYVNLLCTRLLHGMVTARRTYVDPIDVRRIAQALAEDVSPSHWSHLWEDGDAEEEEERLRRQRSAALVLSAFGADASERSLRIADIASILEEECEGAVPSGINIEDTLETLVRRRVLVTEGSGADRRYKITFEIFRWWLRINSRSQLLLVHQQESSLLPGSKIEQPSAPEAMPTVVSADFPLADDDLIPISEGLFYRGKNVDAMQIKLWLKQFHDDARIILAFKLLTALRNRWYFDETKVSLAVDKAYQRGLELAKSAGVIPKAVSPSRSPSEVAFKPEYLRRDSFKGVIANIYVSYFGEPLKSGADVARALKREKRIASAGNLRLAADWLEREGGIAAKDRFVLVVDDFVGSGYQASKEVRRFLKQYPEKKKVREAIEEGRFVYVPLWAYREGIEAIQDDVPKLKVHAISILDESDQAFAKEAEIFDSDDERKIAEALCRHIGGQLYREHPLGWENVQSLVVFPSTTPNATLPIFWSSGIVDERQWKPLFPR